MFIRSFVESAVAAGLATPIDEVHIKLLRHDENQEDQTAAPAEPALKWPDHTTNTGPSMPEASRQPSPWQIHFFQRHPEDDPSRSVPAVDFLDSLPAKVAAEIHAVLDAVAAAPPPAFSGGGKWQAMHGEMAGFYEVRVQGAGQNHRLLCLLERNAEDLGGSSIVCLAGLSKPRRSPARQTDYDRGRRLAAEFRRRRTILPD